MLSDGGKGLMFAACFTALAVGRAEPAVAQTSIQVSAQVISLEPINQGLAEAGRLFAVPAAAWGRVGVRTETRLAIVTRVAALRGPSSTETDPVTITIAFLRN